jgi:PPP family 3-phenylpropionic acid transporter
MSTNAAREAGLSPELRATAFYFTQYMTAGAATVYAAIWFAGRGLTNEQIGIINALPVLVMLLFNMLVGRLADRAPDWRGVIVLGTVLGGFIPFGLFLVHEFWGILAVWTLAALPLMAVGPVADAATMRMTRRRGTQFGPIRAWGTIGYMGAIFSTGYIVSWFGGGIFLPFFIALGLMRALVSLGLPRFRAPADGVRAPQPGASRLGEALKPFFVLPLVGWSMVFATHLVLNAFQALLWKQQGLGEDVIGPLIALGAMSEAAMMFAFGRFARRFSARWLLLVSAGVAVFRWICMGFEPGVLLLVPLQLLHSITFALGFMGCMHFIANWTSDEIAAEAQGFFQMLQQAMSVVALIGFGWLTGIMGARAYFVAAVFAALGGVLIWLSIAMQAPRQADGARPR